MRRSSEIAVLALLLLLACAPAAGAATRTAAPAGVGMLLRLHQLPRGYVVDEGVGCGVIDPEGSERPLEHFILSHSPRGCEATYDRAYPVAAKEPDPPLAVSVVLDLRNAGGARSVAAVLPELMARWTGNVIPREARPAVRIGPDTRLFRGRANVLGHGRPASILTWRQGLLLGMTLVGGGGRKANDHDVAVLAREQRAHMRRPTPYPAAARDDLLVPLYNPAITLPVYWLGRTLHPGAGAAPLPLTSAYGPFAEGEAPEGSELELWYDQGALRLGTWTPQSWAAYTGGKLGRELLTWPCTKTKSLAVAGGVATLYSGYPKDYASCPGKPASVFAAVVEVGGVVLGMDLPACYSCLGGGLDAAELEAAVGALRLLRPAS